MGASPRPDWTSIGLAYSHPLPLDLPILYRLCNNVMGTTPRQVCIKCFPRVFCPSQVFRAGNKEEQPASGDGQLQTVGRAPSPEARPPQRNATQRQSPSVGSGRTASPRPDARTNPPGFAVGARRRRQAFLPGGRRAPQHCSRHSRRRRAVTQLPGETAGPPPPVRAATGLLRPLEDAARGGSALSQRRGQPQDGPRQPPADPSMPGPPTLAGGENTQHPSPRCGFCKNTV